MPTVFSPALLDIQQTFNSEIAALGGKTLDTWSEGETLLMRAVLPRTQEVRPKDSIQGGLALRASGPDLHVHPYTFRQVCKNGAIAPQTLGTVILHRPAADHILPFEAEKTLEELRAALRESAEPAVFSKFVNSMRTALDVQADMALHILPLLRHLPRSAATEYFKQIVSRFSREGDRTLFGLMNAITSVARDTREPERRWRIEELGGGILAKLHKPTPPPESSAARSRETAPAADWLDRTEDAVRLEEAVSLDDGRFSRSAVLESAQARPQVTRQVPR